MNKKISQKLIFDVSNDIVEVLKKHGVSGGFFVTETIDVHIPDSNITYKTISYADFFIVEKSGISIIERTEEETVFGCHNNKINKRDVIGFLKGVEQGLDSLIKKLQTFSTGILNGISE